MLYMPGSRVSQCACILLTLAFFLLLTASLILYAVYSILPLFSLTVHGTSSSSSQKVAGSGLSNTGLRPRWVKADHWFTAPGCRKQERTEKEQFKSNSRTSKWTHVCDFIGVKKIKRCSWWRRWSKLRLIRTARKHNWGDPTVLG